MDSSLARTLWHLLETVNAVTYFSPECQEAPEKLGLKGFWMGYFGCRAAPLGPVGPGVVEATFFNFHPRRVRNAIPEAWTHASPTDIVEVRAAAAAAALRRLLPDGEAEQLAEAISGSLQQVIVAADPGGRPLFAANRDVSLPEDPVAAMWQYATTLREHRGDTHVALLTGAGLDGNEAHVLFAASETVPSGVFLQSRGWSTDEWDAAHDRLEARGLVTAKDVLTAAGKQLRIDIERRTDEISLAPYETLTRTGIDELINTLRPAARKIAASGDIRYPNPMGLPPV